MTITKYSNRKLLPPHLQQDSIFRKLLPPKSSEEKVKEIRKNPLSADYSDKKPGEE